MKSRFLFLALIGAFLLLNAGSAEARGGHSDEHENDDHHYDNDHEDHYDKDDEKDEHEHHSDYKEKDDDEHEHGPAAPEPISSSLFALGAGAVALKKLRDRK